MWKIQYWLFFSISFQFFSIFNFFTQATFAPEDTNSCRWYHVNVKIDFYKTSVRSEDSMIMYSFLYFEIYFDRIRQEWKRALLNIYISKYILQNISFQIYYLLQLNSTAEKPLLRNGYWIKISLLFFLLHSFKILDWNKTTDKDQIYFDKCKCIFLQNIYFQIYTFPNIFCQIYLSK